MKDWTMGDAPSQRGKLAIVTGATGGLGYEIALALSQAGAEVIVAGRNPDKGYAALARLERAGPASVRFESLDLADLSSVHDFADRLLAQNVPIDILVNNAGVMMLPRRTTTRDGFEMQFGTNHLGHFALTGRLLPMLRRAGGPRVVSISSAAHRNGKIDFPDLQAEQAYRPIKAYGQSKLANLLFSQELQRRSERNGWGITSIAAHPGMARTDLMVNGPGTSGVWGWVGMLLNPIAAPAALAALPTLFAATSPDATPAGYYGPKHLFEMNGPVAPAKISTRALDMDTAKQLWDTSENLTGVRY
ncbi:oxidoreductase [Paraburkholderia sp. GAS32]|uniref:oxidoreductase n=1 Tax=Paraburkholderia sp. GAS32 TaxID=3035129 RepID=UPI003D1F9A16